MRLLPSIARLLSQDSAEDLIAAFASRQVSGETSLEDFWKLRGGTQPASTLAALVKHDLQRRFDLGERPRIAEYLERFPSLKANSNQVVSLVYEEFCLRQEQGEDLDSQQFCDAYAPWRDSLMSQLAYHRDLSVAIGAQSPALPFPAVGDKFDKYHLIKLIGVGAVGKVFLANEDDLGGRKVVIKVSASFGQEPTILARLKHRNIMPILTDAQSDSGLRGICMPYRSGLTLEELIRKISREGSPLASRDLREILRSVENLAEIPVEQRRPGWDDFPEDRPFAEAVAWIGLALADALAYVHSRGVLHRDIKPANILLTHEDGPQLLDFNLAQDPEAPDHLRASMKGGTLPYMAPEHLQAFLDSSAWNDVGPSADLYSLGLVLRELLTGTPPELPDASASLPRAIQGLIDHRTRPLIPARRINPLIPPSLDAILEKCLAFEVSQRYASASDLSQDLSLFLDRLPLQHAENPSKTERSVNWLVRNRALVGSISTCFLLLAGFFLLRTPDSIPARSDFRRAVRQLDSTMASEWEKARETFAELSRIHPESAWPALHLALTLDKIRNQNPKPDTNLDEELNRLIQEAYNKSDAEDVFRARLDAEPNSVMLLTNYAMLLLKSPTDYERRKNKSQRDETSRKLLMKALELDPKHIMTLSNLIKLERTASNYERAIELNFMAITIMTKLGLGPEKIYAFRNVLISSLSKLGDRLIDQGATPADRLQASGHFDTLVATLKDMGRDQRMIESGKGADNHRFLVEIYEGNVASGRGVIAADAHNFALARTFFDSAEQRFEDALKVIPNDMASRAGYRASVLDQKNKLQARRERFLKDDRLQAATKN